MDNSEQQLHQQQHGPKSCISQDVMNIQYEMKYNNILCDAKIIVDDGTSFNVHRIILCACSDYFRFVIIFFCLI